MPTVEPGYNDIGLCVTSAIAAGILWYNNSSLLTVTLLSSVRTPLFYNDTKYSKLFSPFHAVVTELDCILALRL